MWREKLGDGFFSTNYVLRGKGFYISYNPDTSLGYTGITYLGNILGVNLKDGEETALKTKTGKWRILEGDFRKQYEKAFPNYQKCLAVYKKYKKTNNSNWTT